MSEETPRAPLVNYALALSLLLNFYLYTQYSAIFVGTTPGYAYHPESGRVFELEFSPYIHPRVKWRYLLPFVAPSMTSIYSAEFVGGLEELERQLEAELILRRNDPQAWMEQFRAESNRMVEEILRRVEGIDPLVLWDARLYVRRDLDALALIPPEWVDVLRNPNRSGDDLFAADLLVTRSESLRGGSHTSIETEVLRGALVLQGIAGRRLRAHYRQEPERQTRER